MERIFRLIGCILMVLMVAVTLEAATITYTDKMGRVVTVPVPVNRAVIFHFPDLIPVLGIWDKVVGIGRWAYDDDLMRAIKPDIERAIPSAGSSNNVNMEVLLKQKPDIVITWSNYPEAVRFMEEKGLKVIAISPDSLPELYEVMRLYGRLFSKEEQMEHAISEMEKILNLIKERVLKIPVSKKKKVLYIYNKPTLVACAVGVTNDIFKLVGGINPPSSIPQKHADVSMEKIIAWNPDVIFITDIAKYTAEDIMNNPQWKFIKAVKEGKVYKVPKSWSTWSPTHAMISLWMAMKTYPEYFRDVNLEKISDDFYRKVFGIPYSKVKKFE